MDGEEGKTKLTIHTKHDSPSTDLVVTTCKDDDGTTIVRIDRLPLNTVDYSKVVHAGSGPYTGIFINKRSETDEWKLRGTVERYHVRFKFIVYLDAGIGDRSFSELKESREVYIWFNDDVSSKDLRKERGKEFFLKLTTPETFPKEYPYFIRRALLLTHLRNFIDTVELRFKPIVDLPSLPIESPLPSPTPTPPPPISPPLPLRMPTPPRSPTPPPPPPIPPPIIETPLTKSPEISPVPSNIENFITVLTPSVYDYQYLTEVTVSKKNVLQFRVKASRDAYIALSSVYGDTLRKTYEICLGCNDNNKIEIRYGGRGPVVAEKISKNLLNEDDFKDFWLHWTTRGLLELGVGSKYNKNSVSILSWKIPEKMQHSINCVSVSTDNNSEGTWEFIETIRNTTTQSKEEDGKRRQEILRKMRMLLSWFAKKQKILQILEDSYPNSMSTNDILKLCNIKQQDFMSTIVFLNGLQKKSLVKEVKNGIWLRCPTSGRRSSVIDDSHEICFVEYLPSFSYNSKPTIAIITSHYTDKMAVDAMLDGKISYVRHKIGGESSVYTIGNIGKLNIVATKLACLTTSNSDQGQAISDGNAVTRLLGAFPGIKHVLIVGICGGVPNFQNRASHCRRGDIVISNQYHLCLKIKQRQQQSGYDFEIKEWQADNDQLSHLISNVISIKDFNSAVERGLDVLEGNESNFHKPAIKTDKLFAINDEQLVQVQHPDEDNSPPFHVGSMGAGKLITRNYHLRMRYANRYKVLAYDNNISAVLESINGSRIFSWALIKAVADYDDGTTDFSWKSYASLAAAAYTRTLLKNLQ